MCAAEARCAVLTFTSFGTSVPADLVHGEIVTGEGEPRSKVLHKSEEFSNVKHPES